eukprot:TRINITY_DN74087_c0_g1_i1.p1 TRINITY_DN74087_c0_g1~~TRINITY_DN74087_c0_g1_i1.p1  ORF type:complete len:135 (+),score=23.35 TRINITY_DN74087_c0_g1_i1:32-406(+)
MSACCEHIAVHTKEENHPMREFLVDFLLVDDEGKQSKCNDASVFKSRTSNVLLYRSKEGDWVVGKELGKKSKGAVLRSQDPDRESFIQECPCQTSVWQWRDGNAWRTDNKLRVVIRKDKITLEM